MMKFLIVPMLLLLPFAASADTLNLNTSLDNVGGEAYGTTSQPDLLEILGTIINVILGFLGVIFLVLTLYAGFLWMTAGGNDEAVVKAKNILKTSIIGLIIVLAAYSIAGFVVKEIGDATLNSSS